RAINEFKAEVGKPAWDWTPPAKNEALVEAVSADYADAIGAAYTISNKSERQDRLAQLRDEAVARFANADAEPPVDAGEVQGVFASVETRSVRGRILNGDPRIDGRDTRTVRPIAVETGVLPRTHGSALFTRGETQAVVVATLGAIRDAQIVE